VWYSSPDLQTTVIRSFSSAQPRRNLPAFCSRKRGESMFVSAFAATYVQSFKLRGIAGREFAVAGFGIADLVCFAWESTHDEEGRGFSLEAKREDLRRLSLKAFEIKLTDWRKGLSQAYRYTYFANCSILVVPLSAAKAAKEHLPLFRAAGVGLWMFDRKLRRISRLFTPKRSKPKSEHARSKAIKHLERFLSRPTSRRA